MKALCKETYLIYIGPIENNFLKNKWYKYDISSPNSVFIKVYYNYYDAELFTRIDFNRYFYTKKELRILKLKQINESSM